MKIKIFWTEMYADGIFGTEEKVKYIILNLPDFPGFLIWSTVITLINL